MKIENIDSLIKRLASEIQHTQTAPAQVASLKRLKEIAKIYAGDDKLISFGDLVDKIKKEKDELRIMSGWPSLDELLKGFRLQQLVVVSAMTKQGKTSWLMDLSSRIGQYDPLWLPYEESAEELIRKYLERGFDPPHGITPASMKDNQIAWIESKIVEARAKYNTRVVFIDQLDFLVPMGGDNHSLRVGQVMRDLKTLAKKWNVVIFIICHLVKTRMDTEPTLEDLKGSSSIAQEADTVILLWRETKRISGQVVTTNNTNVSVQANRRTGKTGNIKMVYEKGRFIEQEWKHAADDVEKDFASF